MPRYFFDIDNGVAVRDDVGQDFPDYDRAQGEAFQRAADYASAAGNLRTGGAVVVTVRDGPTSIVAKLRIVCQFENF